MSEFTEKTLLDIAKFSIAVGAKWAKNRGVAFAETRTFDARDSSGVIGRFRVTIHYSDIYPIEDN